VNIKLRFILILLIGVLLSPKLYYAQTNNDYMDLLLFYVDEKYDICFNKAMKYTEKDKTKKDPLPYLYVSKASFEMSRDHKYTNSFPKAYKTAISFAAKYRKKDKEYKFKSDAEDYIDAFKMIIVEDIENYILEGTDATYGKATGLCKKTCDMDPEDYGAKLLYALLCNLTKNKSTAKEYFKLCKPKLEEYKDNKFSLKYMTKSQQFILRFALIEFANYYKKKDPSKAKTMLENGKHLFYEENEFSKISYNLDYKLIYDNL
tara:strand:+ start:521 stop:1303 length:783 start_codon:yes stop_codon:yes gene_type:complete